jgi:hypothetical protein
MRILIFQFFSEYLPKDKFDDVFLHVEVKNSDLGFLVSENKLIAKFTGEEFPAQNSLI